ncbi:hypothetical protein [Streptomyces sp. NPDC006274]|uniref:hypothetical protein n=1 Tax=unclassified Streptomyces TaxID=2593676 RepID=UPI0033BEF908
MTTEALQPSAALDKAADDLQAHLNDPELTHGPWLSMCRGDRLVHAGPRHEHFPPVRVVDEPMSNGANADYIALMHPGIGRHLVELLRDEAADTRIEHETVDTSQRTALLGIAHLINNRPR